MDKKELLTLAYNDTLKLLTPDEVEAVDKFNRLFTANIIKTITANTIINNLNLRNDKDG